MSRWDPYLDLDTGVLRNLLRIADPAELARAEAELTALRLAELSAVPLPGHYDLAHLQGFHRVVFGDVYDWAGQLRTVSLGRSGQLFCLPEDIPRAAADLFGLLAARDQLRGLGRAGFLDGLTALAAELNALHPFREGNGRTQRALLGQLARDAGHPLRWAGLAKAENTAAARAAFDGDRKPLRTLLDALLVR